MDTSSSEPRTRRVADDADARIRRELAALAERHGPRWPEHREWLEAYVREEQRQQQAWPGSTPKTHR